VLHGHSPWPFPYRERTDAEKKLNIHQQKDEVVALWDKLIEVPLNIEPPGLSTHFLGLVTQRRAYWTPFATELSGVWGFKIRTGDHAWLAGRVWTDPTIEPTTDPQIVFKSNGQLIEAGAIRCSLFSEKE